MKKTFSLLIITLTVLSCSVSHTNTNISEKETAKAQEPDKLDSAVMKSYSDKLIDRNIIGVIMEGYYVTKTGRIVGRDSLFIFDNAPDCETEGFIRFRDHKTDMTGLFDRNGNVAIPAEYNYLGKVMNGTIKAKKGAERRALDPRDEHDNNPWVGGKWMLIDTLNNVLLEDISYSPADDEDYIALHDFFSIKRTEVPNPDTTIKSFLGKDGGYYSFIGYKTKLKQWLTDLLLNPTVEKLINVSNDSITIDFGTDYVSIKIDRREFITDNFETLKKELHGTPYISSLIGWLEYYYCGNSKKGIYPDMGVAGFSENNSDGNNYYMFSQTDKGYILTGVAIRNDKLKLNADTRRNIRKESCYAECRD